VRKEPNLSRRILVWAVMAFCMTLIVWMAWNGRDNSDIHKLIVDGCFFLIGLVVVFYVLGANIDLGLNIIAARFGSQQQRRVDDAPRVPLRRRTVDHHREPDSEVE
jgi:hypothetical protein